MVDSHKPLLEKQANVEKQTNTPCLSQPVKQVCAQIALWLSLLTLLGILALGYYFYKLQQKWEGIEQTVLKQAKIDVDKIDALDQQKAKEQQNFETLTKNVENVQMKLASLSQDSDLTLITLHSLATSAHERLQIAHDLPTGLLQLQTMNEKLAAIDDPNFAPLKEALAKDIATLQNFPIAQRQATWEELAQLSEKFNQLSFKKPDIFLDNNNEASITAPSEKAWEKGLWRTWQELKSLVKVTREDTSNIPLSLSLQEKGQVLRAMQLMAEQAQWAVLNAQVVVYQKSLENLQKILHDYFSADIHQTSLIQEIEKLQHINISWENVNIAQTQDALSHLMKKHNAHKTLSLPVRENP